MNPPREMRIHVQRIFGIPAPQNMPPHLENMGQFAPPPPPPQPQEQNEVKYKWCIYINSAIVIFNNSYNFRNVWMSFY